MLVHHNRQRRNDRLGSNETMQGPMKPNDVSSRPKRMSPSTVSKAADKSRTSSDI